MAGPQPLFVRWRDHDVRVRHNDPLLGVYSPIVVWLRSAMAITTSVDTLRLVLPRATGYEVRVDDDGLTVRLRRR